MRICLLKVAAIADDPRVRRQGDALTAAGHDVWAVGTQGGRSTPPAWPVMAVPPPSRTAAAKATAAARLLVLGRLPPAAPLLYWSFVENRRLLAAARSEPADLYLANDWRTLPVAVSAAAAAGAAYGYDSHELGVEEFLERRLWRLLFPPWIRSLERKTIGDASFVSTVSEGIADTLEHSYGLRRRPAVIRNLPDYRHASFRPTADLIEVLYQGMFISNRGLEPLIQSVRDWRPEFRLTIRGLGKRAYEDRLHRLVAASPEAHRIRLAPPVPMMDMVGAAAAADIGIHPLQVTSDQMRYTLPNKLFEYLMAGLAVCVRDVPEMADVVGRYDVGETIESTTPSAIAAAVNRFDRSRIDACKRRALDAAQELCWDRERDRLTAAVDGLAVAAS